MRRILTLFTLLMLSGVLAFAQNRLVSGKVADKDGNPIAFATVKVKGSNIGTQADVNGVFSLKVKEGTVLQISATGYTPSEINVGSKSIIVEVLDRSSSNTIAEVVVTAMGIKRQPKELGYATTKVSSEDLNQAKVTNIATGLAGKVSGLQINLVNNGVKPDTRITLRGNRSILGNNQALLVVDDIQLPISYIATLNPNDVDNVTVLKGASASALYGSDASNGVIIVTTKKGVRGKPIVRFSSTASFENVAYMPKLQNQFGQYGGENDPNQYPGIVVFPNQPYIPYVPYENQSYGPRYNGQRVPIGAPIRIFRSDGTYFIAQDSGTYSAQPNAKRDFFDNGLTLTNDVSYAAGDDKSKFFFSFQDVNAKGIIPKDVNRRDAIRASGSKESGMFRLDYSVGYTITNTNTTPGTGVPYSSTAINNLGGYTGGGSYFQNRPVYWTLINTPANINLRNYQNWQSNPYANPDGYFNAYYGNPFWQIDQTRLAEKNNDLLANFAIGFKPADWINFQVKATIARNDYNNKYTQVGYNFAAWAIADTLGSGNIPSGVKKLSPNEGDAVSYSQRLSNEWLMSIHKTVRNLDVKFIAGTSLNVLTQRNITTSTTALVIPNLYNISNTLGIPSYGEGTLEVRRFGIFGDLTLGFKNYLFIHGSLRNDWTSLLLNPNNSYSYPAVDAAFVFTDAIKALKGNHFLSFGKIRAAYSKTAQVSVGAYSTSNTFNVGTGFPLNVPGFTVNGAYANPNIKPEISTDKEVGLELGFLKNRVMFSAAVYNTSTINQTIPITISSSTGYTSAYVNSGEMTNNGYEFDLKISPIVSTRSGFRWDINANYSYNKNIVQSLGYGLTSVAVGGAAAVVGEAYPSVRANDWNRDPDGHIIVNPLNGYPTLNNTPKTFGTGNPTTKIGLGTTLSFKGFTLNVVADGRFGAVILNGIGPNLDFTGVSWYSAQSGRQPFVIPNSVYLLNGKYVANTNITTQDGNANFWASTWNQSQSNYINSADFWKIREFSLGYTFPQKLMNKTIKGLSVQITGRNLFTYKAKENIWSDPEFANTNGNGVGTTDINQLPPTKFVAFSLNVTF